MRFQVDKLSRDSDLILEEFPQGMEASLVRYCLLFFPTRYNQFPSFQTAQNVVNLSANTKHYAITEVCHYSVVTSDVN